MPPPSNPTFLIAVIVVAAHSARFIWSSPVPGVTMSSRGTSISRYRMFVGSALVMLCWTIIARGCTAMYLGPHDYNFGPLFYLLWASMTYANFRNRLDEQNALAAAP